MSNELKFIDLVDRAAATARSAQSSDIDQMQSLHRILEEIVTEVGELVQLDSRIKDQTIDAAQTACSLVETLLAADLEGSSESLEAVCKTVDTIHELAKQIQETAGDHNLSEPSGSQAEPQVPAQQVSEPVSELPTEPDEDDAAPTRQQLEESSMVISAGNEPVEEIEADDCNPPKSEIKEETPVLEETAGQQDSNPQEDASPGENTIERDPAAETAAGSDVESSDVVVSQEAKTPPDAQAAEETETEPQAQADEADSVTKAAIPEANTEPEMPAETPQAAEAAPTEAVDADEPVQETIAESAQPEEEVKAEPQPQSGAEEPKEEIIDQEDSKLDEDDLPLVMDFITEAAEHIENAEAGLLEVETAPDDSEAINRIFRAFHTVKGMAGFLNLFDIGSLAHVAENLLDLGRKGEIQLVGPNMDVIFESVDMLKVMMETLQKAAEGDGIVAHNPELPALLVKLKAAVEGEPAESSAPTPSASDEPEADSETLTEPEDSAAGEVPEEIQESVVSSQEPEPDTKPEQETQPEAGERTAEPPEAAEPVIEEKQPQPEQNTDAEKPETAPAPAAKAKVPESRTQAPKAASGPAVEKPQAAAKPSPAAKSQAPAAGKAKQAVSDEKIKVSTQRLDDLVNMVGELVIAQSMVAQGIQNTDISQDHSLTAKINHQSKIVRELQELSMMMRMVPIQGVFQKMARLVRDLSQKSGKKVDFLTEGEDTELDRIVVDQIADPLVHMIRNSVDHGIEPAEERAAAGKSATGLVKLRSFHQAGNIVIEIIDDGRGLNKEKLLKKAIANGIVNEQSDLTDQEIYKLIFHAGFSTAEKVTDISGRGVGMDVVKKNIESLRGKVEIQSELGKGTTFTIRLPLTMAIIDGQIVRIGTQRYIIPIVSIECCIRPTESQISTVAGKGEMAMVQGQLVPMVRLYKLFGVTPDSELPHESSLVVVEEDGKKGSLVVDELLGQQQVVIKSLGAGIGRVRGISGGAIMGDGRVSLIIDVPGLLESAWEKKSSISSILSE